jgi:AcrR family transcriptional regulator
MSGKKAAPRPAAKLDRRARRTRDLLGDALVDLMHEKRFEDITVQQVLDRAEVGRSTFYAHYSDKNDLFFSDVDEFWESMATRLLRHNDASNRVAPVRELFSHVADVKVFRTALMESGKMHDVMDLGIGHFARGIEERLRTLQTDDGGPSFRRQAIAHTLAGALFSMLMWWIDRGTPESPDEMDALYHELVWSGAPAASRQSAPKTLRSANC